MRVFMTLMVLALAVPASAGLILSGDGTETCTLLGGGSCTLVGISVHPRWQPNNPKGNGAIWESFADTGQPGTVSAPNNANPLMRVTETFLAAANSTLWLNVWADDTAEVFIDGNSVFAPNFTQNICANGAIGCEPGEQGMIHHTFTTSGTHTVDIDVWQQGGGPFGVLYSGRVPEPGTPVLLAVGLVGLTTNKRRSSART